MGARGPRHQRAVLHPPCLVAGSDFQRFVFNSSGAPQPPVSPKPAAAWGILYSGGPAVGPSSRPGGGCSAGVGETGPCCVRTNGWWDWNLGPSACSPADFNELVSFADGRVQMRPDGRASERRCWSVWDYPVGGYEVQHWAKPLPGGAAALLVINSNQSHSQNVSVQLSAVFGLTGAVRVRDVWAHTDNGTARGALTATVGAADSLFVVLTPEVGGEMATPLWD